MRRSTKQGFTLTEVLLAMVVIGVISALSIPQLSKSIQKDKAGMVLGKAVHQIELGCQNMIQDYNNREGGGTERASFADNLNALDGDFAFSLDSLSGYIGAKRVDFNAGSGNFAILASRYKFEKFPAEIYDQRLRNPVLTDDRDSIIYPALLIDVNGMDNRPNAAGVDRFTFQLRNDGKLIPVGLNSNTCDGENPAVIDRNCTARVVRDGFKIKYNW